MGYTKYLNQIWDVAIFGCALNHKLSMPMPLQCWLWTLENPSTTGALGAGQLDKKKKFVGQETWLNIVFQQAALYTKKGSNSLFKWLNTKQMVRFQQSKGLMGS